MPWDGRGDYGRARAAYEGGAGPPPAGYPVLAGSPTQGPGPGSPSAGNLFAFLEEQQRRAHQGIDWPDSGHGKTSCIFFTCNV